MKSSFVIASLLLFPGACFSQQKEIVGSRIYKDPVNKTQLLIRKDGYIQQGSGLAFEDVWQRDFRRGTYTFNKGLLSIMWLGINETTETWRVTFVNNFKAAKILCTVPGSQAKKTYLFLKIIDEEVILDN